MDLLSQVIIQVIVCSSKATKDAANSSGILFGWALEALRGELSPLESFINPIGSSWGSFRVV